MIRTGRKFSKPEMSRVINGDRELSSPDSAQDEVSKKRLDLIMTGIYKSYNRSSIQKFIKAGFVKVNGETILKPNTLLPEDITVDLKVPEEMKNADVVPETIYEDENVIVFNKPTGLLSMAKEGYCPEKTLEDFGLLVHRLDRDTSGVVIMAKNKETQSFLRKQFQDRKAHKTYYAVVTGVPKIAEARLDLPIARDKKRPTTFKVDPAGKESETFYKVLKTDEGKMEDGGSRAHNEERAGKTGVRSGGCVDRARTHALVELKPTSGRTHQLRVHMKYLEHPIVGDPIYGTEEAERLYLHAGELEITLPGGVRKTFKVPRPREFDEFFEGDTNNVETDVAGADTDFAKNDTVETNASSESK